MPIGEKGRSSRVLSAGKAEQAVREERCGMESKNIKLDKKGRYCWSYEMSLFKHPWIFLLLMKVLLITIGIMFVLFFLLLCWERNFWWEGFLNLLKVCGIGIAGATVLGALGYCFYALMMGGKYCVEFHMNEDGIEHAQTGRQAKKAEKMGILTVLLAIFSKRPTQAGVGLLATRTRMYSDFAKVKSITPQPKRDTIKLDAPFCHNQVYAKPEDFEWVLAYIREHCEKARVAKAAKKRGRKSKV